MKITYLHEAKKHGGDEEDLDPYKLPKKDPYKLPTNPYKVPKYDPQEIIPLPHGQLDRRKRRLIWIVPSIDDEINEIYYHVGNKDLMVTTQQLFNAFEHGRLISLDNNVWSELENSDSWRIRDLNTARIKAQQYNKTNEDFTTILNTMQMGGYMKAPTVLFRKNLPPFLVGGNTRLMIARAIRIRPKIWAISIP